MRILAYLLIFIIGIACGVMGYASYVLPDPDDETAPTTCEEALALVDEAHAVARFQCRLEPERVEHLQDAPPPPANH